MSDLKLHKRIKMFSVARGLRQQEIASNMGVSVAYVSALLSGRKPISPATLDRLINACGFNVYRREFHRWGALEAGWKIGG